MKLPLVSVLIPNYNSNFLADTLQSVLDQSYKNLEIIVIDDGSTNDSLFVIKNFTSKKIKFFSQTNKGACTARNYAFSVCSGDYIQFLDADDILSPKKLESQVKILENSTELTVSSCQWGRFQDNPNLVHWENQEIDKDYSKPINLLIDCWKGMGMIPVHSWLTPRELIEKAGGWNKSLMINQDGEFFSRVLRHASSVAYSDKAKVYYRSGNSDSISQKNATSYIKAQSLLNSYELYEKNILSTYDNASVREALGMNYLNFIYQFYSLHPNLVKIARANYFSLGFDKMRIVGGENFKRLAEIIGFENALSLKKLFNII